MINLYSNLTSTSQNAFTLCNKSRFGEKKQGRIVYSSYEALYLIENKKAQLIRNNKLLSLNQAIKSLLKNKNYQNNYLVFKDLRRKGYIPKTGLKFGADFRVYCSPKNQKDSLTSTHAKYLVHIVDEKGKMSFKELLTKTRISHSTAKKLLIAIIDSQEDITYLEVDWVKL